jgi:heptaprenyl diphosphate synthase
VFEGLLPSPFPWARIGLSNIVILVALFGLGFKAALLVNLVRIVAGNLFLGIIFSPAFLFSLVGSMSALAAMAVARWKLVPPLSVVGISCLGASLNNAVQVLVFTFLFSGSGMVKGLLGGFILLGVGVGFVTGMVAHQLLKKVVLERAEGVG